MSNSSRNMWSKQLGLIQKFWGKYQKLPLSVKWSLVSVYLLLILYPGQNYYQTLVIKPGNVYSYELPEREIVSYAVADGTPAPSTTARAVIIKDVATRATIYERSPDISLSPASTTKIMTALVALDHYHLEDVITIQNEDRAIGSTMELVQGETLTVESILYGLLVESGNDAALALADNYPGGYDQFIESMNNKAQSLGLSQTTYRNVSGVENYGHTTSARDLSTLAIEAIKHPVINKMMQVKSITVYDTSGKYRHPLVNTNKLLGEVEGLKGLKTGWTEKAGECLVSYVTRNGRDVVIVILGSDDRFGETQNFVNWAYQHHTWQQLEL